MYVCMYVCMRVCERALFTPFIPYIMPITPPKFYLFLSHVTTLILIVK